MAVDSIADAYYRRAQALERGTANRVQSLYRSLGADPAGDFWQGGVGDALEQTTAAGQFAAATSAGEYVDVVADDLGLEAAPHTIDPRAFAGRTSTGGSLKSAFYQTIVQQVAEVAAGRNRVEARQAALGRAVRIGANETANAARNAEAAGIGAHDGMRGYRRKLVTPSCSRCVVLAGKWYEWNEGFRRHPQCDCIHVPSAQMWSDLKNGVPGADQAFVPEEYFASLSEAEQNRIFGKASAEALRNGADMGRVVNADQSTTLAGIYKGGKRGYAYGSKGYNRVGARRTRGTATTRGVGDLLREANGDKEKFRALLREHGYIIDRTVISSSAAETVAVAAADWRTEWQAAVDALGVAEGESVGVAIRNAATDVATVDRHLEGVLKAGSVLDEELDRRLVARLGERGVHPDIAQLEDNLAKGDALLADIKGRSFWTRPPSDFDVRSALDAYPRGPLAGMTDAEHQQAVTAAYERSKLTRRLAELKREAFACDGFLVSQTEYVAAVREESLTLLGELRAMGGQSIPVSTSRGVGKASIKFAAESYPDDWVTAMNAGMPGGTLQLSYKSNGRGYNRGGNEILVSGPDLPIGSGMYGYTANKVAVHEVGHSMEKYIPGLPQLELAFIERRGMASQGQMTLTSGRMHEYYWEDEWRNWYTGRDYFTTRRGMRRGVFDRANQSLFDSYEVFTTGIESLMGGGVNVFNSTDGSLPYDREFRSFILGVMSVL